jgi:tRNA threonylcarbamoyladenosine biosynthesis protein TsaB
MRVLAFDACLGALSAAAGVVRPDGTWARVAQAAARVSAGHAEALMPMIDRVMREADLGFLTLDRIITTLGPGGFTGVRVGLAAARGFVLATGAKGIGLSSLDALAITARDRFRADAGRPITVATDARRGMIFFARYAPGAIRATPELLTADDAAERVTSGSDLLIGSAAEVVAQHSRNGGLVLQGVDLEPEAHVFAPLLAHAAPSDILKPIYLRPPDAKAQTSFVLPRAPA